MERKSSDFERRELLRHLSTVPAHTILQHLQEDTILEIAVKCFEDDKAGNTMTQFLAYQPPLYHVQFQPDAREKKSASKQAGNGAKRPLNAFIAFRSFYVKLFPKSQQKAASGFLTTLWNKDPFRNRWALIAKVYSFIRDELGKQKAPLSGFLAVACLAMNILRPDEYLQALGWVVEDTELGTKRLVQNDELRNPKDPAEVCPDSELGLLHRVIELGYMPSQNTFLSEALIARDSRNGLTSAISITECTAAKTDQEPSSLDTTESASAPNREPSASETDKPLCTPGLEASTPYCATPPCPEETATPTTTCASISTPPPLPNPNHQQQQPSAATAPSPSACSSASPSSSFTLSPYPTESSAAAAATAAVNGSYFRPFYYHNFSAAPTSASAEDAIACSPASSFGGDAFVSLGSGGAGGPTSHAAYGATGTAASSPVVLSLDGVADHQAFDIDCPWEIDSVLGTCTQATGCEQLFVMTGVEYDPHEDFHYTF